MCLHMQYARVCPHRVMPTCRVIRNDFYKWSKFLITAVRFESFTVKDVLQRSPKTQYFVFSYGLTQGLSFWGPKSINRISSRFYCARFDGLSVVVLYSRDLVPTYAAQLMASLPIFVGLNQSWLPDRLLDQLSLHRTTRGRRPGRVMPGATRRGRRSWRPPSRRLHRGTSRRTVLPASPPSTPTRPGPRSPIATRLGGDFVLLAVASPFGRRGESLLPTRTHLLRQRRVRHPSLTRHQQHRHARPGCQAEQESRPRRPDEKHPAHHLAPRVSNVE